MKDVKTQYRKAFRYLKKQHGPTIKALALVGDCSTRHIQAVLSNKEQRGIGGAVGSAIADHFDLTYSDMLNLGQWLLDGNKGEDWVKPTHAVMDLTESGSDTATAHGTIEPSNVSPAPKTGTPHHVPIISWVQAGDWYDAEDPYQPGQADEWSVTVETSSQRAFALVVHGDSMEPIFLEDDIITVDPDLEPQNGDYIIAKNGNEATFKQLIFDGASVYLKPVNDRYPIKDMTGVDFVIVGVVVEKRRSFR